MVLLSAAVKGLLPFLHCFDPGGHSEDFCLFFLLRKRGATLSLLFKDDTIPPLPGS